jgi:tetratricopeptide (TPR) repeat protein
MRALALLILLCAPVARAGDDASAKALARVRAEEAKLREKTQRQLEAQEYKGEAAKKAMKALDRYNNMPDWRIFSKADAEGDAARSKLEYQAAREKADAVQGEYLDVGREYIRAENDFKNATGGYYNEQQYNHVREEIKLTPAAGGPSEPVTGEQAQQEAMNLQKLAAGGKASTAELAARGQNLGRIGDDLMAQTLASNFGAAGAAARAGAAGGGGESAPGASGGGPGGAGVAAAGGIGYGRAAPPPDALSVDKAILLSRPSGGQAVPPADRFLSAGTERLSANDPHGALKAAEAALKDDPKNSKAWGLKAAALNQMRRFGEAELAAKKAVEYDRGNAQAYRDLTWAQLHNGKAEDAEASATRMIFLDPENPEGYLLRAFAYEMKGDRARMLADLERAAALDPRYANHLAHARAGTRLFDPSSPDTDGLLGALAPPPPPRSKGLLWVGGLLLGVAALASLSRSLPSLLDRLKEARRVGPSVQAEPRTTAAAAVRPVPKAPEEGLLAEKYRLSRVAGRGGMGQVWEAVDVTLERVVAIKEMSPELASDPALRGLYLKEARTIATLRHPNIVEIYEILDLPPNLYLVFEWVAGKTVAQVLVEKRRLPLETVKAVLSPVCEALAFAHERGVVHRDLKPSNVMVTGDGHVKLMDFGIARSTGDVASPATAAAAPRAPAAAMARTRTVAGTPGYRPPDAEQGIVTPAFDVYCLGICLYEMLAGELPYGADGWAPGKSFAPLHKAVAGLPEAVDDILARALDPDPATRLKDARALKGALLRL